MNIAVAVAFLTAAAANLGVTAAGAAGTASGDASCVAQLIPVIGTPGASIQDIKQYYSPVPGRLVSSVARGDRTDCRIPE